MQIIKSDTEKGILVCELSTSELEKFSINDGGLTGLDLQAIVDYVAEEDDSGFCDILDEAEALTVNVSSNSPSSVIVQINASNAPESVQDLFNSIATVSEALPVEQDGTDTDQYYGGECDKCQDSDDKDNRVGYEFSNMERVLEAAAVVDDSSSFSSALVKIKDRYLLVLDSNVPNRIKSLLEEYGNCLRVSPARFEFFREHDHLKMEHDAIGMLKRFA